MFLIIFAFLAASMQAGAQLRPEPVTGHFEVKGEFDYLSTSANYPIGGGSSSTLLGGAKLSRMLGVGEVTYDAAEQWKLWAGFSGGQTQATSIDPTQSLPPNYATDNHNTSGPNEGWVGSQWWMYFGDLYLVPQVDFIFPFFRVDQNSNNPLLGEGAIQFSGGSWVMWHWNDFIPFAYGGLTYRDQGRSSLFPYRVGLRYDQPQRWWLQGEFRGYTTVGGDGSDRNLREAYLNRVDGDSYQFYSINPSQGEISAMAGIHFDPVGVYAGVASSVFGNASASSWTIVAGLTIDGSLFKKAEPQAAPDDGFSEKTDKYDEKLFQNKVPITPESPAENATEAPAPPPPPPVKAKPVVRKKKKKADEPMPNVELLMKETEKTLEKKGN